MTDEAQTPTPTVAVTARVEIDNLTRDETIAALDGLPVDASLRVIRKHVVLGGKRFDLTAAHLSTPAAADFVAAVSSHMDDVASSVDRSQFADREDGPELVVPAPSLIRGAVQAYPGRVVISHAKAVELGLRPANPAPVPVHEPWPFKPGDIVRDSGIDADDAAWLDAAPVGVVVVLDDPSRADRDLWVRTAGEIWLNLDGGTSWISSPDLAALGSWRVVSVPEPLEACR